MTNTKNFARQIFDAALQSALPDRLIHDAVSFDGKSIRIENRKFIVKPHQRIFIFGSGKAAVAMADTLYNIIGKQISGGTVLCNVSSPDIGPIRVLESSHPVPTQKTFDATEQLITAMSVLNENDFFIYVISGGSSAIVEKPVPPVTLDDFQTMTGLLLRSGVPIIEMNVVRKHLSMVKGGRLGQLNRASGIVLVLSDVIGDDLSTIGSGLLYKDDSTYNDVETILDKYSISQLIPENVSSIIRQGLDGYIQDTPKAVNPKITHHIIGNNYISLVHAREEALRLGLPAHIMTSRLCGEAREIAKGIVSVGKEILTTENPFSPPVCLIFGGETTVTVCGNGHGGRNQELCLAALNEIHDSPNITFLSAGTDGIDGKSDAAGAVVDCNTFRKSKELNLSIDEYLSRNDSYHFFKQTDDLIITGPTGTNVCDVTVMIVNR